MSSVTCQVSGNGDGVRPDLPGREAAERLAAALAGLRGKALRRVQIGLRTRVLEVGCGHGIVTGELARRAGGGVIALDRDLRSLVAEPVTGPVHAVQADAAALPFAEASFDLVFFENALLWLRDLRAAVAESARVLVPGGSLVAIEPDYGGMMEHPDLGLQAIWLEALAGAGADPVVGRKLPAALEAAGLIVGVELQNLPQPADVAGTQLLLGLPLREHQRTRTEESVRALSASAGTWQAFVHVPYFLVIGEKPG